MIPGKTVYASSGAVTITLPTSASSYTSSNLSGRIYTVKKIDATANQVTIQGAGSETIDGYTNIFTTIQNTAYAIQANGTNWYVVY